MCVHFDAIWQIRMNDCIRRLTGSATGGGDAACSQIILSSLVKLWFGTNGTTIYELLYDSK